MKVVFLILFCLISSVANASNDSSAETMNTVCPPPPIVAQETVEPVTNGVEWHTSYTLGSLKYESISSKTSSIFIEAGTEYYTSLEETELTRSEWPDVPPCDWIPVRKSRFSDNQYAVTIISTGIITNRTNESSYLDTSLPQVAGAATMNSRFRSSASYRPTDGKIKFERYDSQSQSNGNGWQADALETNYFYTAEGLLCRRTETTETREIDLLFISDMIEFNYLPCFDDAEATIADSALEKDVLIGILAETLPPSTTVTAPNQLDLP